MRYWRIDNDLYTGDVKPSEDAVGITEEEYTVVFESRTITHLPEYENSMEVEVDQ